MSLQDEYEIYSFELRPYAAVAAECRLRIEESRRLLKATKEMAEGYRPSRWVA
jgi:hypothetical protein